MKRIVTISSAVLLTVSVFAQSPQKMSYQAVIRNSSNALVTNTPVGMQLSILQGSPTGTVVYAETQTPTTNANGLVSIEIGNGTVVSGNFTTIDWGNGPYFFKTETDPEGGTSYTITGTSQLLSVPYALHAKTAESITGGITETDPLWTASPSFGITSTNVSNWNTAYSWGNHATAGYLTSFTETDPLWTASPSFGITSTNVSNWNTAYSWGNHATAGYLTSFTETDPLWTASPSFGITSTNVSNWNTAYSWGNHATAGYLTSFTETDPLWTTSPSFGITSTNVSNWNTAYSWGNHATAGYLTSFTETDPLWTASPSFGITSTNVSNWNTAYSWGNHAGLYRPVAWVPAWTEVTGKPTFATVATSGSYSDLSNKPTTDGSETKVTAGTNISISGAGTTASPYVVNATGATTLTIGQSYQGGIIFWLDATGQHGLIAATADQSTGMQWYNGTFRYTGTTGDGLYAGAMNTTMIVATQMADTENGNFAAKVCADYSVYVSGVVYGDWYLPSKYELTLLYAQKVAVGGFANAYYWSSNELNNYRAYLQNFSNGVQSNSDKYATLFVRAIRAF